MTTAGRRASAALLGALVGVVGVAAAPARAAEPAFTSRVLVSGLANPWEILTGPDRHLWVTEKSAGRVTRVDMVTGEKKTAVTIPDVVATPGGPQDGLLGMALHPDLLEGTNSNPYAYLTYTYDADPAAAVLLRRQKIVRYTYQRSTGTLGAPLTLIAGLPVTIDHVSGRLVIGPDSKIYYTIGDGGHNQATLYCQPILSQALPTLRQVLTEDWSAYQGKVLRLNLDGTVPLDNPVINGVRSHVYSYGHRNAQGLAFGPTGLLYSTEQGPKSDDELNLITAGGNYGWPHVNGYRDDRAYTYDNWSAAPDCESLTYSDFVTPASVPRQRETAFTDPRLVGPMRTFHTVPNGFNFQDPRCVVGGVAVYHMCWPTIAPSSAAFYASSGVPGWRNSVLVPSLKYGTVYRVPVGADGISAGEPTALWRTVNRYRDLAFGADGRTFYVSTDVSGIAADLAGTPTLGLANPGSILVFTLT
ncbi:MULTISPECIES: glucose/sorbosone family PQQ-dependent dehydrogenase [Catenuloplanes]|uniref:PQQ-dependent dehydrogenase (S-GDH family) n=1 Tax=Catenuloplanes niger TaxID=587534 RepID=A0AAE3ZM62_9ACTN|nr:glucose/sorbosone family PQQ-dependent dehydrogenase [Catenuloplanes niger]MDR7320693.1 PQQ-dependent dehydrogenase (s-GDH family) [Catenuloplanes niger]